MFVDWLLRASGKPGITDDAYLKRVVPVGDTTIHSVQTTVIKQYGFSTKWKTNRDISFVTELLRAGIPTVVNILHRGPISSPRGGHVICLIAIKDKTLISHDPYGTLGSNYRNTNGAYDQIPIDVFMKRWQGHYRIMA